MNSNDMGDVEAAALAQSEWVRAVRALVRSALKDGLDYASSPALIAALDRRAQTLAREAQREGRPILFDAVLAQAHSEILQVL
jgi:hypothetical protein